MHVRLFTESASWSIDDPNPIFVEMATSLGLDATEFETCLDNEEMLARVDADQEEGKPFVQGTPMFILLANNEGRLIPGAVPLETFVETIQATLDALP